MRLVYIRNSSVLLPLGEPACQQIGPGGAFIVYFLQSIFLMNQSEERITTAKSKKKT